MDGKPLDSRLRGNDNLRKSWIYNHTSTGPIIFPALPAALQNPL